MVDHAKRLRIKHLTDDERRNRSFWRGSRFGHRLEVNESRILHTLGFVGIADMLCEVLAQHYFKLLKITINIFALVMGLNLQNDRDGWRFRN